ncbi:hypothetical protein [Streptomyces sp. NPDC051662]|uniref:hypothetical protein n=1 Tax=Streptomyces sp. NPDC051662 TaxID=3154750 RepID=UPI00342A2FDA
MALYSATTGRRLFAAAAEASRISGWCAVDSGHPAPAQRHYLAALRSAGSAADPVITANTLGFWAMLRYSTGDPEGALQLVDAAHRHAAMANAHQASAHDQPPPRTAAPRLTREADAHLALGDVDAAVHTANRAIQTLGGVTSSRGTSLLTGLKSKLAAHTTPLMRDFLESS